MTLDTIVIGLLMANESHVKQKGHLSLMTFILLLAR